MAGLAIKMWTKWSKWSLYFWGKMCYFRFVDFEHISVESYSILNFKVEVISRASSQKYFAKNNYNFDIIEKWSARGKFWQWEEKQLWTPDSDSGPNKMMHAGYSFVKKGLKFQNLQFEKENLQKN